MKKMFIILLCVGLLLIGTVSAYYCIYQEDNDGVKEFKDNLNILSVEKDLQDGLTPDQINLKLKYFGPCK